MPQTVEDLEPLGVARVEALRNEWGLGFRV